MSLLARRDYSCHELAERLHTRGYPPDKVALVVARLAEENAVSDSRYASERVRVRSAQGVGPLRIRAELQAKGVAADVIAAVLDGRDPEWGERASLARSKRFGAELPSDRTERARQSRFLQARGFGFEHIIFAVSTPRT